MGCEGVETVDIARNSGTVFATYKRTLMYINTFFKSCVPMSFSYVILYCVIVERGESSVELLHSCD